MCIISWPYLLNVSWYRCCNAFSSCCVWFASPQSEGPECKSTLEFVCSRCICVFPPQCKHMQVTWKLILCSPVRASVLSWALPALSLHLKGFFRSVSRLLWSESENKLSQCSIDLLVQFENTQEIPRESTKIYHQKLFIIWQPPVASQDVKKTPTTH